MNSEELWRTQSQDENSVQNFVRGHLLYETHLLIYLKKKKLCSSFLPFFHLGK